LKQKSNGHGLPLPLVNRDIQEWQQRIEKKETAHSWDARFCFALRELP